MYEVNSQMSGRKNEISQKSQSRNSDSHAIFVDSSKLSLPEENCRDSGHKKLCKITIMCAKIDSILRTHDPHFANQQTHFKYQP